MATSEFPSFDTSDIGFFFVLCDIYFAKKGFVNELTQFQCLTLNLPLEVSASFKDLVSNPSRNYPYTNLKNAIITRFAQTSETKFETLLKSVKFQGSCSQLYATIVDLSAGLHFHEDTIKKFFNLRLPNELKLQTVNFPDHLTMQQIITRLDQAYAILHEGASTSCTMREEIKPSPSLDSRLLSLEELLRVNTSKLDQLSRVGNVVQTKKFIDHYPRVQTKPKLCYYHAKYGDNALKCIKPCSFQKKLKYSFGLRPQTKVIRDSGPSLITTYDSNSKISFLVDSGSPYSIIPSNCFHNIPFTPKHEIFLAANNSPINVVGSSLLNLRFDFLQNQPIFWNFFRANVAFPILGMDFLQSFQLVIDCFQKKLIRSSCTSNHHSSSLKNQSEENQTSSMILQKVTLPINSFASSSGHCLDQADIVTDESNSSLKNAPNSILEENQTSLSFPSNLQGIHKTRLIPPKVFSSAISSTSLYQNLLAQFPEITQDFSINTPVKHSIYHKIVTTGPPVKAKCRRLNSIQLSFLESHLRELLDAGLIERASSPWSSAIHLVPKPDGSFRMCGDYRSLNAVTVPDTFPIPFIQDFTNKIYGCKIFSKLDLTKAYFHIPIAPEDVPKTTIITPLGAFQYKRMNFGLKNATSTWSLFIGTVLEGLCFLFFYLDDILIFSKSESEHLKHLEIVFGRLRDFGLLLNVGKCVFGVTELDFLGHSVNTEGISPQKAKIEAIRKFPVPRTQRQLRNFLGLITFYHKFLKNGSLHLGPLHASVDQGKSSDKPVILDNLQLQAFENAKQALMEATMLVHPIPSAEISIASDSSAHTVAAVLQQLQNGIWKPLAFCSRKLTRAETRYSTFSRELLAIYFALHKFRFFIEGRVFHILTDHKPLCSAIKNSSNNYLPRELRHLEYISQFTTDIRHVKGIENIVPDTLTRVSFIVPEVSINYEELASKQEDSEFRQLCLQDNFVFEQVISNCGFTVWVETSTGRQRPYIPQPLRHGVFKQFHNLSHPGVRTSRKLIKRRFIWPNMNIDIKNWVKSCHPCQLVKIGKHTRTPLQPIVEPDRKFEKIHLDLVHLPFKNGFKFVLTIIDRFSRWPEAIPLKEASAETVISSIINVWIARFGIPKYVSTDNATIFRSNNWIEFMSVMSIRHIKCSPYHPISQGIIERFHRTLKQALTSHNIHSWPDSLPWVLLGLRSSIKTELDFSSAEILYGSQLRLPGEFFEDDNTEHILLPSFVANLKARMRGVKFFFTKHFPTINSYVPTELLTCTHVYVRDDSHTIGVRPAYMGPFKVIKRSEKCLTLEDHGLVSLDRVKPAFF